MQTVFFKSSNTEKQLHQKVHHDDTFEWKLAQHGSKLDVRVNQAREKLEKRELQKKADNRWFEEHPKRNLLKHALQSKVVEAVIFVVIFSNFVLTIYETDLNSTSRHPPWWLSICLGSFLIFYLIELILRFSVYGPLFFSETSNAVDLIVVLVDVVCAVVTYVSATETRGPAFLRIFRVMRVVRAIRLMKLFHELYLMLYGLFSTLKAIFWAVVLIFIVLNCCSIIAVEFVHPINLEVAADGVYDGTCGRCPRAFRTVGEANLTFIQQILAGDSWGQITVPIVDKAPWTLYFFVLVLLIVNLGLMNLVLTVIVDQATQATHENMEENLIEKMQSFRNSREELMQFCASMDTDATGTITASEIMSGYDSKPRFAHFLNAMDVKRDDLHTLFKILDRDGSGDVSYSEFVEELHKAKSQDPHTMLVFMQYHMQEVRRALGDLANGMKATGSHERLPNLNISALTDLCEESQSGKERTLFNFQPGDTTAKFEHGVKDDDALEFNAGQRAEETVSSESSPKQSSARQSVDCYVEQGVLPPAHVNRTLTPRGTTPAISFPQSSAFRQPAARSFTRPELKHLQDSIVKSIEIIVRDSLAISSERVRELTKHPNFQDLLQGLDTSQSAGEILGDRFLPVQSMEHKGAPNFSGFHQRVSSAENDHGHISGLSIDRQPVSL